MPITRETIQPLVDFNYWANRQVLDAVEQLPADVFTREVGREFSFSTLQGTLAHIMGAEMVWLARWRGASPTGMEPAERYPTVAALGGRWAEVERELRGFIGALGDDGLARVVEYRAMDGRPYRHALWQMIQHVVNHGTHHRSEAATMLTRLGHAPPPTDLIVYYRAQAGG